MTTIFPTVSGSGGEKKFILALKLTLAVAPRFEVIITTNCKMDHLIDTRSASVSNPNIFRRLNSYRVT